MIETIGLIAGIILPLWNIPLIMRIERRKSSEDISLYWAVGVWACLVFMFPSALFSKDIVYKIYSMINILFFTIVMIQTVRYRKR
jgi:uncharacterized protein with PQ loop repeat